MSARATTAHVLAIGDGNSPEVFHKLLGVGNIGDVGSEATIHDASSHDTETGWGSVVMGLKRQKPVTFPVQFDPSSGSHSFSATTGLGYLHEQVPAVLKTFVEHPAGDVTHATRFYGYITALGRPVPVDGILQMMVTITPSGAPEHLDATALSILSPLT